jgi:predicted DNA-binding transcriptional regulator YafY
VNSAIRYARRRAPTAGTGSTRTVGGIEEAALRALATVRQVMPARLRHRVDALRVTTVDRGGGRDRPRVDTGHLLAIGTAVRAREVVRFDYTARSETAVRRAEPHHVVTWGGRWYLVAWDLDREDWRTFRVDRMTPRTPTGPRFTPRRLPAPDVASYIAATFERTVWPCRGEVVLHAPAEQVAPWVGDQGVVEELGPDRCRLHAGSWSWIGLACWVGLFEVDLEIVGPDEFRDAVDRLARRYRAAVSV